MTFDYDLFVIGGGSGGVRAARMAAETGAKVALAEEYRIGGTCVIRGCVPKKIMMFASSHSARMEDAAAFGWNVSAAGFEWSRFWPRLRAELDRLESVYRANLERTGVAIFDQRAVIGNPHTVELEDGRKFVCKHILIATGGKPFLPSNTPGIDLVGTSDDVFLMPELPKSVLIVGGGYIACEFSFILNGLGVETTQYYRGAQILRGFDDDAREHIAAQMGARGIDLKVNVDVAGMERRDGGIMVKATDGRTAMFERVIYATGRRPNTAGLGLERAGVPLGGNGQIEVDGYSQTRVPSIYAVGDVTNRVNLTPVAIREGAAFVRTVFNANPTKVDHSNIPGAVFTQPEFGTVGLTESEAAQQERIEVYSTAFRPMQNSFIDRDERAFFKLVVSKATRRILGVHIIADGAAELIQLAGVALRAGATKEVFDTTVAVHPTMAEEIVLMDSPVRTA